MNIQKCETLLQTEGEPRQPGVPLSPPCSLCPRMLCAPMAHQCRVQSAPAWGTWGHLGTPIDTQGHPGTAATAGPAWELDLARTGPGHCCSRLCQAGFRIPAHLEHTTPGLCYWHCHGPRADWGAGTELPSQHWDTAPHPAPCSP